MLKPSVEDVGNILKAFVVAAATW